MSRFNPNSAMTFTRIDAVLKRKIKRAAEQDRRFLADELVVLLEEALKARARNSKSTPRPTSDGSHD